MGTMSTPPPTPTKLPNTPAIAPTGTESLYALARVAASASGALAACFALAEGSVLNLRFKLLPAYYVTNCQGGLQTTDTDLCPQVRLRPCAKACTPLQLWHSNIQD